MEDCMKNIKENLYCIMGKNDWNFTELAIQCDTPYRTLQSLFYGERKDPRLSTILRMSESLNIPVSSLIERAERR